jgi:hypothetical protein
MPRNRSAHDVSLHCAHAPEYLPSPKRTLTLKGAPITHFYTQDDLGLYGLLLPLADCSHFGGYFVESSTFLTEPVAQTLILPQVLGSRREGFPTVLRGKNTYIS